MSASNETQSGKRPAGGIVEPGKRYKLPLNREGFKLLDDPPIELQKTHPGLSQPEMIKEEQQPAGHVQEDAQVAGDSTQIIQEKPQVAGEFPTETDKEMLSYCAACNKDTDHDYFNCPVKEKIIRMLAYCRVCNKRSDHFTEECPKATEEVLEKLAFCFFCFKNTDHQSSECPHKEKLCVLYNGIYVRNVCTLCGEVGHFGLSCPVNCDNDMSFELNCDKDMSFELNCDKDMSFDSPGDDDEW